MKEDRIESACTETGLKVEGLRFAYTSVWGNDKFAVDHINFLIHPGYIYGLVGRNGAGKTTLIESLLKGEYMKGYVSLDGVSMEEHALQVKEHLGMISYPAKLLLDETLQNNGVYLGSLYPDWKQQEYEKKLEEYGLDKNQMLKNLSKGENMKAQMAFIWEYRPKVLIADSLLRD